MMVQSERFELRSRNSNEVYWEQDVYPAWTRLNCFRPMPDQKRGAGVEPHYHDCDEIWLFTSGRGEVWLNGQSFPITPNALVYTPMGVIHRFQMITDFDNLAIVTPLERRQRATHILVEEEGPPEPTVPGFVVAGANNVGPIAERGPRCPVSELRMVELTPGHRVDEVRLAVNEHWAVLDGRMLLTVDETTATLYPGDIALVRTGATRVLRPLEHVRAVVCRE
jgi:mannose-6-phosphate isomerase-like protein (cupin superfamily)